MANSQIRRKSARNGKLLELISYCSGYGLHITAGLPTGQVGLLLAQAVINGKAQELIVDLQFNYTVQTNGTKINDIKMEKLGIARGDINFNPAASTYIDLPLTPEMVPELEQLPNVISVSKNVYPPNSWEKGTFPFSEKYKWNRDNYGPIWIPEKGATVDLSLENLPLYERIIEVYEDNDLKIEKGEIWINGEKADTYTFKMDYYWMMGDNRHNSADSRYWGFVPFDNVNGKLGFRWISINQENNIPAFNRIGFLK